MRFYVLVLVILIASTAIGAEEKKEPLFNYTVDISEQYGLWAYPRFFSPEEPYIDYHIKPAGYTALGGDVTYIPLGLKLGGNLEVDNNVIGKVRRYNALMGITKLYFRVEQGAYAGSAYWSGYHVVGLPRSAEFNYTFTQVDAMYQVGPDGFLGLRYTSFASPVEVVTLKKDSSDSELLYGNSFFDPGYHIKFYSLTIGFDTFRSATAIFNASRQGWDMFISTSDGFGLGQSQLSQQGIKTAKIVNDGKSLADSRFTTGVIQYEIIPGIKYRKETQSYSFSIGVGYGFFGLALFSFSGPPSPDQVSASFSMTTFVRHGPVIKAQWIF